MIINNSSNVDGNGDTNSQTSFVNKTFPNINPNILKDYETVTYRFSMGAVSGRAFNNASYLQDTADGKDSRFIVFGESGYTGETNTTEKKGSSNSIGNRVITSAGVVEYFIDNYTFEIMMPGMGQSGFSGMAGGSFEVYEPYSLGKFFESLLASAIAAGFSHFNDNCPFIVRVEFFGMKDGVQQPIPDATRVMPIRIQNITFSADESGSKYNVTFLDFGTSFFVSDEVADINDTMSFPMGANLRETFKNLENALNEQQQALVKQKVRQYPDTFRITMNVANTNTTLPSQFNSEVSRWNDEINMLTSLEDYELHKKLSNPTDENPNQTNIRVRKSTKGETLFVYNSAHDTKTTVYSLIDDVMCHTEFAKESIQKVDKEGFTLWWRISGQLSHELGTGGLFGKGSPVHDSFDGRVPMNYVLQVQPFIVRMDRLKKPATKIEDSNVKKSIRKVYSYLYTGLNDDILNFDMTFDNMFYIAGQPQAWSNTAQASLKKILDNRTEAPYKPNGQRDLSILQELSIGNVHVRPDRTVVVKQAGGVGANPTELEVARWINTHVTGFNGSENYQPKVQLSLDLTIIGDTYYLPIAGLSNQFEPSKDEMAWKDSEVRIHVRFRTVNDYPFTGSSLPVTDGEGLKDHPFSGVYRLLMVKNQFTAGMFKQVITLQKDFTIDPDISSSLQQSSSSPQDINPLLSSDFQKGTYDGEAIIPKTAPEISEELGVDLGQGE